MSLEPTAVLSGAVRERTLLTESLDPKDQFELPSRYYKKTSLYGYAHSLPDLLAFWLLLAGIGTLTWPLNAMCAVAAAFVGYRLTFVVHDCAHLTLFSSRAENEIVGRFVASCLLTSFIEFQRLHWVHHRRFCEPSDPQGSDYNGLRPDRDRVILHLLKPLFFVNAIEKAAMFLTVAHSGVSPTERAAEDARRRQGDGRRRRKRWQSLVEIGGVQALIALVTTRLFRFALGYALFLALLASLGLFASRLRSYLEHGIIDAHTPDETRIARTNRSNWLECNVLCSLSFNYHNEHHRWPHVPAQHLPVLHREVTAGRIPDHDFAPSYLASIRTLVRASRHK
jgi:fatty acid desaturase